MLEGVLSMQNLISDPVSMTSCRQEAYLLRLRRQFPFVYVKTLTRTAFGRSVYALQFGSGSRKLLITAGHHADDHVGRRLAVAVHVLQCAAGRQNGLRRRSAGAVS